MVIPPAIIRVRAREEHALRLWFIFFRYGPPTILRVECSKSWRRVYTTIGTLHAWLALPLIFIMMQIIQEF